MSDLHVVLVWVTGFEGNRHAPPYEAMYVRIMKSMLERHLSEPFQLWCIVDELTAPDLPEGVSPIRLPWTPRGWWSKLALFSPHMPEGRILFLDLDMVVVRDLAPLLALTEPGKLLAIRDLNRRSRTFASAFLSFHSGDFPDLWRVFESAPQTADRPSPGDQRWIGERIGERAKFVCDHLAEPVVSWKWERQKVGASSTFIAAFHGRPKPHQVVDDAWLREHWK